MDRDLYKIEVNGFIDYEGKLNNHDDYLRMLNIIEDKCSFIGIAGENEIVEIFKKDIIKIEESSSWWTEETSYVEKLYYIKSSKELFDQLRKYETFCKTVLRKNKYFNIDNLEVDETDFGSSDIAFFDKDYNILLATVTHEGFIHVSSEIDKLFKD